MIWLRQRSETGHSENVVRKAEDAIRVLANCRDPGLGIEKMTLCEMKCLSYLLEGHWQPRWDNLSRFIQAGLRARLKVSCSSDKDEINKALVRLHSEIVEKMVRELPSIKTQLAMNPVKVLMRWIRKEILPRPVREGARKRKHYSIETEELLYQTSVGKSRESLSPPVKWCLHFAMLELNSMERVILWLHYAHGLSYNKMASLLNHPKHLMEYCDGPCSDIEIQPRAAPWTEQALAATVLKAKRKLKHPLRMRIDRASSAGLLGKTDFPFDWNALVAPGMSTCLRR